MQQDETLTPLGFYLGTIPTEIHLGKVLLYGKHLPPLLDEGAMFRCVDPILTIAAALSYRSPFLSPFQAREEANAKKAQFKRGNSDHLTVLNAYTQWSQLSGKREQKQWCFDNFLSDATLRQIKDLRSQYAQILAEIGFIPPGTLRDGAMVLP